MSDASQKETPQLMQSRNWKRLHIDPTISIGHIITTLTIAISMVWWASSVETRLSSHAIEIRHLAEADATNAKGVEERRKELRDELKEIRQELREINLALRIVKR